MTSLFTELALVFAIAGVLGIILARLKQPSIAAYIAVGAVLGPFGFGLMRQGDVFHELSSLGVALLLFLVGLELNTDELKKYSKNAIGAGIAQVTLTAIIGLGIALLLGFSVLSSVYIALALTFSSTILVIKILSEKKDLQSLSGRIVVGILLTQDFIALFLLIILSGLGSDQSNLLDIAYTVLKGIGFTFGAWWLGKRVLERLLQKFGKSDELLQVIALGWGLGLAALAASPVFNFSLEIGGFLAGISLARSAVHHQINAKVRSLRDFFLVLFFVVLGSQLDFGQISSMAIPAIWLTIFVLIGNPLVVLLVLARFGYSPRTSFLSAISLGQVSEFSLILATLGNRLGHISDSTFGLLALVSIGSMIASSFLITHSESLYLKLKPLITLIPLWQGKAEHDQKIKNYKNHVIILGAHQMGSRLAEMLQKKKISILVVDFDPEIVEKFHRLGIDAICGDAADGHIQELAGFNKARLIISTLPQLQDNLALAESISGLAKKPKLIVSSNLDSQAKELYKAGFAYVILPHQLSSLHLSHLISGTNITARLRQLHNKYQ